MAMLLTFFASTVGRFVAIFLLGFVVGFWACHRISNWWNGREERTSNTSVTIKSVDSGVSFTAEAGLRGRKTRAVTLYGISDEKGGKENLISLLPIGKTARIEIVEGRRIGSGDIDGIVTAPSGTNCNLDQLQKGFAKNTCDRKDFQQAEAIAKKNKLGCWCIYIPDAKPHFWRQGELW